MIKQSLAQDIYIEPAYALLLSSKPQGQFVRKEHVNAAGTVKRRCKQHSAHLGLVHINVVMQAFGGLTVIPMWSTVQ